MCVGPKHSNCVPNYVGVCLFQSLGSGFSEDSVSPYCAPGSPGGRLAGLPPRPRGRKEGNEAPACICEVQSYEEA